MKQNEMVTICNRVFKVKRETIPFERCYINEAGCNRDEIYENYGRPSRTKVSVWHEWCDWCEAVNKVIGASCSIRIVAAGCQFFSIGGWIKWNGQLYTIHITAMHNDLYKIV